MADISTRSGAADPLAMSSVHDELPDLSVRSPDEITEALQISKSATSNAINLLLQTEQIEYTTFPGDRKRYFRLKIANWREGFTKKMEDMTSFSLLLKEVLNERNPETTEFNRNLEELADFMAYVNSALPGLLESWEKTRKG